MSVVTERCKTCIYYRTNGHTPGVPPSCDYILIEGERRGCSAGNDCDKYSKYLKEGKCGRTRLPTTESILYEMYGEGMTDTEIADNLGVSPKVIMNWRHQRTLPSKHSLRRSHLYED